MRSLTARCAGFSIYAPSVCILFLTYFLFFISSNFTYNKACVLPVTKDEMGQIDEQYEIQLKESYNE